VNDIVHTGTAAPARAPGAGWYGLKVLSLDTLSVPTLMCDHHSTQEHSIPHLYHAMRP
jgi:hypothetical protein